VGRERHLHLACHRGYLGRVQGRLKRLGVRRNLIGRVISLIRERAEEIKVRSSIEISPDPKDEPFCHCSEQGKGDFIITLNPDDFPQEHLRAKVVAPRLFLA